MPDPELRINELERRSSFQEKTIQDLNQVIIEHSDRMKKTEARLKMMEDRLSEFSELVKRIEDEEPPPHY